MEEGILGGWGWGGEGKPDLVKHIVNADAKWKWSQVLLADVAVCGYHGTAVFRALGEQVGCDTERQEDKHAWRETADRTSHLKVLSLDVGVTKPRPPSQEAAAQVSGVHVEVPTQENHICILGCVAGRAE